MKKSSNIGAHAFCAASLITTVLVSAVQADTFDGVVDSPASSALLSGATIIHTTGTLIGDYDPDTNPSGTKTIPGLFGGSGNNPINIELSGQIDTELDTNPTGSMAIDADFDALTIDLSGLTLDLLGGEVGQAQPSIALLYSTFHTTAPSFIYPGGIPLEIPLGEGSSIDAAVAAQTGPGAGLLTPTGDPDVFDFTLAVPAEIALSFTLGFDGIDLPEGGIDPVQIVLPLTGTIERLNDGSVILQVSVETQMIDQSAPIEGISTPEIPFELPTLGSDTAGVLLTLMPDLLSVGIEYGWSLTVLGSPNACAADFTGDGQLDFFDISAFLTAYSSGDPIADFTNDGAFDFFDISAFLTAYTVGCP